MSRAEQSVDLDMPLAEFLSRRPASIAVFLRYDMLCVGCLVGRFHTVVDACIEHEVDEDEFVRALRQAMSAPLTFNVGYLARHHFMPL